ncbi:zinc transporter 6-like [Haliotis rufescens]|uniref:zinc transporter 6-like n=1 Tax=Haliotis rufescens TaxID=6454 RepID=UPI00201FA1BD|nr:zinc transporter 6-like [Haliotis rufescens]
MTSYGSMPDLISSSVSMQGVQGGAAREDGTKYYTSGTIYPFSSSKALRGTFFKELSTVLSLKEGKKISLFLALNVACTMILLLWCHSTNSMALTAFTYLTIFDIFSLLTCLLSLWVQLQQPSSAYSFGYERFEVVAVFASTMLAQLGSFFIVKESVECLLQQHEVHTGRMLVGTVLACVIHFLVTFGVNNRAMNHVVAASSSSWLQEHMTDMSESLCHIVPGLSKLLLPRLNPFVLIAMAGATFLVITYILIDTKLYYSADTMSAVCIAIMTCGTLFPMSVYTGKILLQTTPSHILGQLDKVLREASTLDGVLEFRHEHFWTLSFGILAGSVQVRVRRDADEQMVLAHVYNRLSNLVAVLNIQIFKDDWTRSSAYAMMGTPSFNYTPTPPASAPPRPQSPPSVPPPYPPQAHRTNLPGGFTPSVLHAGDNVSKMPTPLMPPMGQGAAHLSSLHMS